MCCQWLKLSKFNHLDIGPGVDQVADKGDDASVANLPVHMRSVQQQAVQPPPLFVRVLTSENVASLCIARHELLPRQRAVVVPYVVRVPVGPEARQAFPPRCRPGSP